MFLSNTNFHLLNDSSLNPSKESTLQKRPITISIIKDPIKERERGTIENRIESNGIDEGAWSDEQRQLKPRSQKLVDDCALSLIP